MTLRRTFVLAFATVAAVVAILVGWLSFAVTDRSLHNEIDRSLTAAAATYAAGDTLQLGSDPGSAEVPDGPGSPDRGDRQGIIQTAESISSTGVIRDLIGAGILLPADEIDLSLSAAGAPAGMQRVHDAEVAGTSYRLLTRALGSGKGAVKVARNLDEVNRVLRRQAISTLVIALIVVLVAALIGAWIARRITRRLTGLTRAAEQVSTTGRLDVPIAAGGQDEVGRLSAAMALMLGDLARSREDQQRLVQNAGHELRTPLTSLRTNATVLRRFTELSPTSQQRLLDDVDGETRELTDLVNELVELATDRRHEELLAPTDLTALADRVAGTFRRRTGREILVRSTAPVGGPPIPAREHAVERALSNLVDNALKFDPHGTAAVEIVVGDGSLTVLDRGPGVKPADADRIFDRFYRSDEARSLPGSGLGLSIVADVAASHGGQVAAAARPSGGSAIGFSLRPGRFSTDSLPRS